MKKLALFAVVAMLSGTVSAAPQAQGGGARAGGAAGGGQGQGAGRGGVPLGGVDPILVGAIDTHMHSGPDSRGRSIDFLDAVRYAKLRGMRGAVLKHHRTP